MATQAAAYFLLTLLLGGCVGEGEDRPTTVPTVELVASNGGGRIIDHLPGNLTITILGVAPGSSVLLQSPGAVALFDTGTDSSSSRESLEGALRARGVTRLDYLVLSHPGQDRVGGCAAVLEDFDVVRVLHPGLAGSTQAWKACKAAIEEAGVPVLASLRAGQVLRADDHLVFEILAADPKAQPTEDGGLAIRVSYGGFSLILVGDRSCKALQQMVAPGVQLRADVLELPLHGTAACPAWLDATTPRYAYYDPGPAAPARAILADLDQRGIQLLPSRETTITSDGHGTRVTA